MNDKSLTKVICRIINLMVYVFTILFILLLAYTKLQEDIEVIQSFFENYIGVIIICAVPIIIIMIISLIIKYKMEDKSKINIYRILDTVTRLVCTIPISISVDYYIWEYAGFSELVNALIGLIVFVVIDKLLKLTLQETLSVSFIIHDEL